jgi:hypothetical protein
MRAEEIKGLMEAYAKVHETPEVLSEEVVKESVEQVDEVWDSGKPQKYTPSQLDKSMSNLGKSASKNLGFGGSTSGPRTYMGVKTGGGPATSSAKPGVSNIPTSTSKSPYTQKNLSGDQYKAYKAGGGDAAMAKGSGTAAEIIARGRKALTPSGSGSGRSGSSGSGSSGSGSTPRPAPTAAPKPTATPTPAKPAGSAMDQWAKANPKLAAAKAERDRTRGTSATTNPLMKDMKSSMPAPKSPAPSTAKTGFDLAKKGVNLAAGVDIFDLVKGHLLDEGYAETEENALVMMSNMSEEWRESIIMELTGGKGHPGYKAGSKDHGPMETGHPADSEKRKDKGGTMSMRHGHHLGDMDDEDEDEDDLESVVKQQSRDSRERVRKPLRDKVKAARKKMTKEEVDINEKMEKWIQKVIDEGRYTSLQALSAESEKRKADKKRGRPETESEVHGRLMLGKFRPGASQEERAEGGRQRLKDREKVPKKGGKDMFEEVLEYLVAEGYADTNEAAISIIANMGEEWMVSIFEEIEQLDEVSKTDDGTRARIKMFAGKKGIEFEPGPRWDPSANRGKGANLSPKQMEKQRRKKLRQEDLEAWVDELIAEGYDLSDYTWEEVAEIYAQELELTEAEIMKHQKERDRIEANKKRFAKSKTMSYEPPTKGKHGEIERRMAKRPPSRLRSGSLPEELETEGYQRDPEKGEKENKKYENVRGERTPMPPRGDKRREDFEKWYRANVR